MCDLRREFFVVHEQEVDFLDVIDNESFEAVGQEVSGLSAVLSVYTEKITGVGDRR